jgi:hypothetical protein
MKITEEIINRVKQILKLVNNNKISSAPLDAHLNTQNKIRTNGSICERDGDILVKGKSHILCYLFDHKYTVSEEVPTRYSICLCSRCSRKKRVKHHVVLIV